MSNRALTLAMSSTVLMLTSTSFADDASGLAQAAPHATAQVSAREASTGEQVKTLSGGAVLRLAPNTRIETLPGTRLQLGPTAATKTPTHVIKLISGRIDIDIPPPSGKVPVTAVLIQGPRKASGIAKGGHSVAIVEPSRVVFAAVDGEMVTASGNDWRVMASGLTRTFAGADPTPQEHPVPSAPSVELDHGLMLALPGETSGAGVRIKSNERAARYGLKLWSVNGTKKELIRSLEAETAAQQIADLVPGHYEVTARVFDASSVDSAESAPQPLRVIGVEMPEGARVAEGALWIGLKSRVRMVGVEGLEATYGTSTHFVAAPQTVGLIRGESTLLRLRDRQSKQELKLMLEPSTIKADVNIGPRRARWPKDSVAVQVKLFDHRGRPVDESVKVDAAVHINIRDAHVNWSRSGNELRATIPTPMEPGPWVVRVEIRDEFGEPVAHDFLEVAASGN